MNVTHFNREARSGNFTFEQLFGAIRNELKKHIDVCSHDIPRGYSRIEAIAWAWNLKGSINHITGDVNFLAYGLPSNRTILTVHDLGHYMHTLHGLKRHLYRRFWWDFPLRKVAHLTAISDFTKRQLVEELNFPSDRITVIPDPLLPGFEHQPKPFDPEKPVILQIGSGRNKNLGRLIEAVRGLPVRLLLVNQLQDDKLRRQLIKSRLEFEQRCDLSFGELLQAYKDCDLLFFASEYEGFGMPILEAQATGRPVVTSWLASMPEVAGTEGAIFCDPFSVESIRTAVVKVLEDRSQREKLVTEGLKNVRRFSIESIAKQYLNLYHQFVN